MFLLQKTKDSYRKWNELRYWLYNFYICKLYIYNNSLPKAEQPLTNVFNVRKFKFPITFSKIWCVQKLFSRRMIHPFLSHVHTGWAKSPCEFSLTTSNDKICKDSESPNSSPAGCSTLYSCLTPTYSLCINPTCCDDFIWNILEYENYYA